MTDLGNLETDLITLGKHYIQNTQYISGQSKVKYEEKSHD